MENVQIRVREGCGGGLWDYAIWVNNKKTVLQYDSWYFAKSSAIRAAKAMAKRIGIPYDPEILKEHGC